MALQKKIIPTALPISYIHEEIDKNKPLVLFLHGFTDSGTSLHKRALKGQTLKYNALAPNAPFPTPVKTETGYKEAYAWYFWDPATNTILISPSVSCGILTELIKELGYENSPKVIVGFSQGGYLAPFLIPSLKNFKGMITIGVGFKPESYTHEIAYPIFAIHGDADHVVPLQSSKEGFYTIAKKAQGKMEFQIIKDLGHTISEEVTALMLKKIDDFLNY